MKKAIIVIFILLSATKMYSQFLAGLVYDKDSNTVIANAEILLLPDKIETKTNSKGIFTLQDLEFKRYGVVVKHINYETDTVVVEIIRGLVKKEIPMVAISYHNLKEVIITDTAEDISPYLTYKIRKNTIINDATRDIGEYIKNLPNVSGVKKGGTGIDPVIRGFRHNQINTYIDGGIRIEGGCPNRMDPALAHIETEDINHIEIIKGPYALRYGPSFGGIVKIKTSHPMLHKEWEVDVKAKRGYESNWDGHSEYVNVNGGNNLVFFNFSASRKDYDNYIAGNGVRYKTAFKKYGYSAELGTQPFKNHIASFSYNESFGRNVFYPALPMDEKSDDTRIMSADYKIRKISKTIELLNLNSYYTEVDHLMNNHFRPFSDTVMANSLIKARDMGYRAEIKIVPSKSSMLYIGTDLEAVTKDGEREKVKIKEPTTPHMYDNLWLESIIENHGLFAEYQARIFDIHWVIASRLDHNKAHSEDTLALYNSITEEYVFKETDSEFSNLSSSIGATKDLSKALSIQLVIGKGTRSPNMVERFIKRLPVGYDKYDYLGNPLLKPESNYQIDLAINYSFLNLGRLSVNGFYSMVDNYIKSEITPPSVAKPLSPGALGVKQFINAEDWVYFRGFELIWQFQNTKPFNGQISAAYTNTLDMKAYDVAKQEYRQDALPEIPPLELHANFGYEFFNDKVTPRIKAKYALAQKEVSKAFNEESTPAYFVIDFALKVKYSKNLTLNLGAQNLLDELYYEHLNRNIIGSNKPFYEPGRNFFINAILTL